MSIRTVPINVSETTRELLRRVAEEQGKKLYSLADRILVPELRKLVRKNGSKR